MAFQLEACTAKITLKPHYDYPTVFQDISVKVTFPGQGKIGSLSATRVRREFCGGQFLSMMDGHSHDLMSLAFGLFDERGRVQAWLPSDPQRKGTGCWGRELNSGALIHIIDVSVKEEYQNQGVGSWMIKKLLESQYITQNDNVTSWPAPTGAVTEKAQWIALQDKQVAFFRKNGFRRIGRTAFFGYSPNPSHPSRLLPASADADANDL
ncbi:hypothetical protein Hypma_002761 [Hypsizygus marmoreus]|uniref:N-acetyltransferase domain-containing protein n=1 Tax=Hypsizygus marmoreus TaxID=39966 RepID=A0A369J3F6_HYPMA|nr:hypothetical protein Hypma_002761 [Hypsizygus marmoreus]